MGTFVGSVADMDGKELKVELLEDGVIWVCVDGAYHNVAELGPAGARALAALLIAAASRSERAERKEPAGIREEEWLPPNARKTPNMGGEY